MSALSILPKERALELIYASLAEINASRPPQSKISASPDTKLLGPEGRLDSLDVVEMIVSLEGQLTRYLKRKIVLLDETISSHDNSPLQDISTLATFLTDHVA